MCGRCSYSGSYGTSVLGGAVDLPSAFEVESDSGAEVPNPPVPEPETVAADVLEDVPVNEPAGTVPRPGTVRGSAVDADHDSWRGDGR